MGRRQGTPLPRPPGPPAHRAPRRGRRRSPLTGADAVLLRPSRHHRLLGRARHHAPARHRRHRPRRSPAPAPGSPARPVLAAAALERKRTATLQRALENAHGRCDSSPRLRSDLDAARADAARLLGDDAELPETALLPQLIHTLRGHLMVLIPHVEDLSQAPSCATGPRRAALAGVDEARRRLDAAPGRTYISEIKHAQDLARSVDALCWHAQQALTTSVAS
ncbi:DUF6415 family natural product biosynthesis protein [Streptomyces sp. DT193]|uniref:DUF6415 family natural product biosynthesis protein n=1 Tax=Streptomyces sp. DT193 TaxID=3393418 RepID=UPI003CE9E0A0